MNHFQWSHKDIKDDNIDEKIDKKIIFSNHQITIRKVIEYVGISLVSYK